MWPAGLATPYPFVPATVRRPGRAGLAVLLLAALTAGVVAARKQRPWLLVGWLWYLGMLFPVIGLIQISPDAAHADRYTYLPEIGLVLAVAWGVAEWSAGWKQRRWMLGRVDDGRSSAGLIVCGHAQPRIGARGKPCGAARWPAPPTTVWRTTISATRSTKKAGWRTPWPNTTRP